MLLRLTRRQNQHSRIKSSMERAHFPQVTKIHSSSDWLFRDGSKTSGKYRGALRIMARIRREKWVNAIREFLSGARDYNTGERGDSLNDEVLAICRWCNILVHTIPYHTIPTPRIYLQRRDVTNGNEEAGQYIVPEPGRDIRQATFWK